MNTLQRQQSILSIFKNELASSKLHASSIKAMTPEQQSIQSGACLAHITSGKLRKIPLNDEAKLAVERFYEG